MNLLRRLYDTYLSVSSSSFGPVTLLVDHCPHCDEQTPWIARALTGYVRCTQCGCDPMHTAEEPTPCSPPSASDRSSRQRFPAGRPSDPEAQRAGERTPTAA